jgi:sirohydrochlorin ferrochelatase
MHGSERPPGECCFEALDWNGPLILSGDHQRAPEIALVAECAARDSKDPDATALLVPAAAWQTLLTEIRNAHS